jgi:glycosyltransferase involved in cell wall biosynthesis
LAEQKKTLLFITHDTSRTGAPILLLDLIKVLKEEGFIIHTLIRGAKGPLFNEFQKHSHSVLEYSKIEINIKGRGIRHWLTKKSFEYELKKLLAKVDIVISNTISNGQLLGLIAKDFKGPIITYAHELEIISKSFKKIFLDTLRHTHIFAVPCNAVKTFLVEKHNVPDEKFAFLNYYIPPISIQTNNSLPSFMERYKINASMIVGGAGTVEWRKSPDVFIEIAYLVFKQLKDADMQFFWIGADKTSLNYEKLQYDIDRLKLTGKVVIAESIEEAPLFFKAIDLFLLTSKEDPYPLVVLEAALQKVPTIAFSQAGGAPEFIGDDGGSIVDYLDTEMAASAILNYYDNRKNAVKAGLNAYNKLTTLHQNKALIVEQFETMISKYSS